MATLAGKTHTETLMYMQTQFSRSNLWDVLRNASKKWNDFKTVQQRCRHTVNHLSLPFHLAYNNIL